MSEVHATAQTNRGAVRTPEGSVTAAMAETLKLYHAWLG